MNFLAFGANLQWLVRYVWSAGSSGASHSCGNEANKANWTGELASQENCTNIGISVGICIGIGETIMQNLGHL